MTPKLTGSMHSLLIGISVLVSVLLSGCAPVFLVSAGVGAGAFSYIAGNLTRVYEADYEQSVEASINVMEKLNFKRKEESTEELKTTIEGYLYHDTPVTIEVISVGAEWTKIGVRTGYIGLDNLEISEQVHADIAEQLAALNKPTIKARFAKKKDAPSESTPTIARTQYDTLPPPPTTDTSLVSSPAEQPRSPGKEQEESTLFPTKSKTKTFIYYPRSLVTIPPGSYGALDDIISHLKKNPSAQVDISGYTDSSGSSAKNLALSKERAFEIRTYLIENGIAEERITAQGLGATNFLESNRTERLRTMNRRVEITIK